GWEERIPGTAGQEVGLHDRGRLAVGVQELESDVVLGVLREPAPEPGRGTDDERRLLDGVTRTGEDEPGQVADRRLREARVVLAARMPLHLDRELRRFRLRRDDDVGRLA